jgi:uncharacterized membrane protein YgdD (TMEM256/DUF423 family)
MSLPERILVVLASLSGLLGVGLSAAAAHVAGGSLATAAQFLLFHAPAILALVALTAGGALNVTLARLAGFVLILGLALFCGDLSRRAFSGTPSCPWRPRPEASC